ncbi:MAG: hypothetical protein ACYC0Y_28360, partial [Pirellulales bacterium]
MTFQQATAGGPPFRAARLLASVSLPGLNAMRAKRSQLELSDAARDALQSQFLRVRSWKIASMVWDRVFTPQERRKLGENAARCHRDLGTVGMWREVRGGSET